MSEQIEREYAYRPPTNLVTIIPLTFGGLCAVCVWAALTSEQGIRLFNVFEFSPVVARILFWVFAGLFAALFLGVLPFVLNALTRRQRIAFTSDGLLVPQSFMSRRERIIAFRDIIEVIRHVDPQGFESLIVRYTDGKFVIADLYLPSKQAFAEVSALLRERLAALSRSDSQRKAN